MIDFSGHKIAKSAGVNTTPIAATSTQAPNGTLVIDKHNAFVDAVQAAFNALPPPPVPPSSATWDSNKKSAGTTLSSDGLTASFSSPYTSGAVVLSTLGKSTGKWCWELTFAGSNAGVIGVGSSATDLSHTTDDNVYIGMDANAWGYSLYDGRVVHNAVNVGGITATNFGTTSINIPILCALDCDAGTLKLYKNSTLFGTISGLSGTLFAGSSNDYAPANVALPSCIANFGQTAFTNTVPVGYLPLG